MKRDAASTIFRTVVFAGAMLGAPGCGKKQAASTTPPPADPALMQGGETGGDPCAGDPCAGDPCAGDPCAGRPRGTDDDGGGGMGRGFILS
jgi:hypothetical protein